MAIALTGVGPAYNIPLLRYVVDTENDKDAIDTRSVPMGSTCYVIETSKNYMLNSEKDWILQDWVYPVY
jgi:hypothetical protein